MNYYTVKNLKNESYYLHWTVVTLRTHFKKQLLYYFSRVLDSNKAMTSIPEGMEVVWSKSGVLPVLRKIRA